MQRILSVVTATDTSDLTRLETVKEELGIETSATDNMLSRWIKEESDFISNYCRRTFAQETVTETFYLSNRGTISPISRRCEPVLALSRKPVTEIVSITEDDDALVAADYEVDAASGLLYRLSDDAERIDWDAYKIVVTYTGGYELLGTLPRAIEQACLKLVSLRWNARGRDPSLRSREIPGVMSETYWVSTGDEELPEDIERLLCPFVDLPT